MQLTELADKARRNPVPTAISVAILALAVGIFVSVAGVVLLYVVTHLISTTVRVQFDQDTPAIESRLKGRPLWLHVGWFLPNGILLALVVFAFMKARESVLMILLNA